MSEAGVNYFLRIKSVPAYDQLTFGIQSNVGRQLILTDIGNDAKDHDHATQTNPTLFVHSATDPDTSNTQWWSIAHDQTDAVYNLGTGDHKFTGGDVYVFGTNNLNVGGTYAATIYGTTGAAQNALRVVASGNDASGVAHIEKSHTSATGLAMFIRNKGTGSLIQCDNNSGTRLVVDNSGHVSSGASDSAYGLFRAYGNGTLSATGGAFQVYTAADHDTSIDYFQIRANEDDLELCSVTTAKLSYKGAEDRWDFASDVLIAAGKDLDCYTNAGYFKPRRVSQSAQPTPDSAELLVWRDTDDNKTYILYNDPDVGVRSVEMA